MIHKLRVFGLLIALAIPGVRFVPIAQPVKGSEWELVYSYLDDGAVPPQIRVAAARLSERDGHRQRVVRSFNEPEISLPWEIRPPSAFAPRGPTLALIQWNGNQGRALLLDTETQSSIQLSDVAVADLYTTTVLGWSADGARVLFFDESGGRGRILSATLSGGMATGIELADYALDSGQVALSPDAATVLYCNRWGVRGCAGYALRRLDMTVGQGAGLPAGSECRGYPVMKWSPNAGSIALGCTLNGVPALLLIDGRNGALLRAPLPIDAADFDWSEDSGRLLIDPCESLIITFQDSTCAPLLFLDAASGVTIRGPAIERVEERRMLWLDNTVVLNMSAGEGLEAEIYLYDLRAGQGWIFAHADAVDEGANFTILGARRLN
jgi:hypothetical protein